MPILEESAEFFVGYFNRMPAGIRKRVRLFVILLSLGVIAIAATLATSQAEFSEGRFEFGLDHHYEGTLFEWPYPMLIAGDRAYLLVGEGKHGASQDVHGLDGQAVALEGSLIENGADHMIELRAGTLRPAKKPLNIRPNVTAGPVTLTGEIVDTKCHLGVMNPGSGKVHRDCAVRCISGGAPPALLLRTPAGESRMVLLTGADGRQLNNEILDYVAEPIRISGVLSRSASFWVFRAEPRDFQRE
jgi:hypothetical protein